MSQRKRLLRFLPKLDVPKFAWCAAAALRPPLLSSTTLFDPVRAAAPAISRSRFASRFRETIRQFPATKLLSQQRVRIRQRGLKVVLAIAIPLDRHRRDSNRDREEIPTISSNFS
jgi:hypothetical protein